MGDLLKDLAGGAGTLVGGPGTALGTVVGGNASPLNLVGNAAQDAIGDAIEGKAEEFLWDLAQSVVDGTQVLFHMIVDLMLQLSEPQVTGEFIYTMGGRIFFISLPLIVAFAALRIISASVRAQALTGARDAFIGAGVSVLGTVALVPLTAIAVRAVDAVADGMLRATLADGDQFVDEVMAAVVQLGTLVGNLVGGSEISGPISPWEVPAGGVIATSLICLAAAFLLIVACVIIGLALVARNMLLYIVIVVGPLCLSGLAWGPTRRWASIWLGWMVALIFTKLAIVVVMGLGVLAVTSTIQAGAISADPLPGLTTVLSGVLMLILAAFMPVACFALFGWMGEAGVRELQGAASGAQGALTSVPVTALSAGQTATGRLSSLLDGGGGSGQGSSSGLVGGEAGGDSGGGGDADTAAETGKGAAVAATAGSGGLAAGAVVASEVASEAGEAGEGVADGVQENIGGAVSETTETTKTDGDGPAGASSTAGGEQSYSAEGSAPGESAGDGGSSAPVMSDVPMSGEGPAAGEPAPVEAPPGGTESSVPVDAAPAAHMPLPEPAPVATDTGTSQEPVSSDFPPAPASAPLEVPVTGENAEGST
ncbi:type IV secretion system protein [Brachybacterium sp. J153]|uniref:type IV secretion system protein n=1 Tax=Brachybacterium sp. J153 TaxID=3116488 RepID=UPI002E799AC8|nr:type IV secretion system protein [Brachybacterium sp. J153]MEE1616977.1 type IV secretion system protein [Brachybacterium sp. J153]